MRKTIHGFLSAFSLVSRFPVKLACEPDYADFSLWMPITGLFAASAAILGFLLGRLIFGPGLLCALFALLSQYLWFNLFHFDGLVDSADAVGAAGGATGGATGGAVEQRRKALKDPHVGAFALFFGVVFLLARLFAGARLCIGSTTLFLGATFLACTAGRFAAVLLGSFAEPAGQTGLAARLGKLSFMKATIGYSIAVLPAALFFGIKFGALGSGAAILAGGLLAIMTSSFVALWYAKKLGGYSGDAMGAAIELTELLVLLLSACFIPDNLIIML